MLLLFVICMLMCLAIGSIYWHGVWRCTVFVFVVVGGCAGWLGLFRLTSVAFVV